MTFEREILAAIFTMIQRATRLNMILPNETIKFTQGQKVCLTLVR